MTFSTEHREGSLVARAVIPGYFMHLGSRCGELHISASVDGARDVRVALTAQVQDQPNSWLAQLGDDLFGAMPLLHRGILYGLLPDGFSNTKWVKISRGGHKIGHSERIGHIKTDLR